MDKAIVAPECISKELLEDALRNYFNDGGIKILEYTSKSALAKGENYTSDIFRSTVAYSVGEKEKKESISVIIKCFPENEMVLNLVQQLGIFDVEAYIYKNVLPDINNTLGDSQQISAKCIYYMKGPKSVIIFEDLSAMNFKMHPRLQGLDLEHCLLVVEKLAYLHGTSLVLYEKDSSPINKFTEGIFGSSEFTANWLATGFNALIEASSKWPGFEKFSSKLKVIKDQAIERIMKVKEMANFKVLNHGDSWINNFMFLYDPDGKVNDLRFVDFQGVLYGSPVIDLNYFFATSPNIEVKNQHLGTIFDHYYAKLLETLNKLKYPLTTVPSKEELREEFNSSAFYGLAGAATVLPVVTVSSRNDATLEDIMVNGNEDGFRHDAYNNERYRKHMEFLLPFYDNLGILD